VLVRFAKTRIGVRCADAGEPQGRDCSTPSRSQLADIAADGKSILVIEDSEHPHYGVYLVRADGSPPVRLGDGGAASLSADGKWAVAFILAEEPSLALYPTGPGEPRRVPLEKGFKPLWSTRFLPDGKRLILAGAAAGHRARFYERRLDAEELRPLTEEGLRIGYVSPDGNWLAFVMEDDKLHVKGPDGAERTYPFKEGLPGLWEPVGWSRDGNTAYLYDGGTGAQMRVYRMDLRSGRSELWKSLPGVVSRGGLRSVVVALDGAAYAYRTLQVFVSLYLLDGMR
jgi:hypothetical protein